MIHPFPSIAPAAALSGAGLVAAERPFADIHPLHVTKVARKGRDARDVDQVITWLTGYDVDGLRRAVDEGVDLETFFAQAPRMNPDASLITGVVCGHRVEDVEDPLTRQIRWMDKLVDEVARGKRMSSILRGGAPSAAPPARAGG